MSRLIVLTLPMVLLWLVFQSGVKRGGDDVSRVDQGQLRTELSSERGIRNGASSKLREKLGHSTARTLEKLESESLSTKRSNLGIKASEKLVDQIMAAIGSELLSELDAADLDQLRSYVSRLSSPAASEQAWLCWGPDVSKEKAAAFHEAEKLTGLAGDGYALFANQFLGSGNWDRTATDGFTGEIQGLPITLTWSIVPDGTSTPGAQGAASVSSDFRSWMASIYGGSTAGTAESQVWFEIFRDAFEAMAETCGVTLVYEPNDDGASINTFRPGILGVRGDIRIAARAVDGDSGTLAFAFSPDNGDMVFDSTDSTFDNTSSSSLRLFNVIAHELGHSLGLAHVCPLNQTKLLEPILTTRFKGPRFDEHQSLQRLYGDRLEPSQGSPDNDSAEDATFVELVEDETSQISRLSIDDNLDEDFFRISALDGQKLSVSVRPGEGTYLEGADTADGCSAGTNFESSDVHDLRIQVLASDGVTELTLANEVGLGEVEVIDQFELMSDGDYFVRVSGDTSNAAQLYRIDLRLGDRDPGARLRERESIVLAESGSVKNTRLDPNETIKLGIEIENVGVLPTGTLGVAVTGSDNVSVFASKISPVIAGSDMGTVEIVFAALGDCGEFANLNIEIFDDSGSLLTFEQELQMGEIITTFEIDEDFDEGGDLPDGWESIVSGAGVAWEPSSTRFASALFSAFSSGAASSSESSLVSPSFVLTADGGQLSFEHAYDIENRFDGAVLEASRDEGAWFDLIESPSVSVTGGYTQTIRSNFGSAIEGQMAWSGNQGSFITTTVDLPSEWAGESIRFRWRFVHDRSTLSDGWWIDNVKVKIETTDCELHRPALSLALTSGALDENDPTQDVLLSLSSELPLGEALDVTLVAAGSASGADFSGSLLTTIAAGQQSAEVIFSVSNDELVEGEETLTVTIPSDQVSFAPSANAFANLTVTDLFTVNTWLAQFFSESVPLDGDSDGDGLSEIAEYLLGTDPSSAESKRVFTLQAEGSDFLIPLSDLPERNDATLGLEFSTDLIDWVPRDFMLREDGLLVSPMEGKGFLRLTFSLDQ